MSSLPHPKTDTRVFGLSALVLVSLYLGVQMLSDIASLKIGVVLGLAVDLGTFLYPLTFTLRDMVHKNLGKRSAQQLILAAGALNLFMALYLGLTTIVPPDPSWALDPAWSAVFSPVWRIVAASIVAEVVSELTDTEIFHRVREAIERRHGKKHQWLGVLASNSVSIPLDNVIFCGLAFAVDFPGSPGLPLDVVAQIFLVNLVVKFGLSLVSLPGIYLVRPGRSDAAR